MNTTHKIKTRSLSEQFKSTLHSLPLSPLNLANPTNTFDLSIRAPLWEEFTQQPESADTSFRACVVLDYALFDSFLNRIREDTQRKLEEEIRSGAGVELTQFEKMRTDPNVQGFFKKVSLANENLNRVLNILNMIDFYARMEITSKPVKKTLDVLNWQSKSCITDHGKKIGYKFLKTSVKVTAFCANTSITPRDTFQLFSRISLLLFIRSNPILSIGLGVTPLAFSTLALPLLGKTLHWLGFFTTIEKGLEKHQLTSFIVAQTPEVEMLTFRLEKLGKELADYFEEWLEKAEEEDEKSILKERVSIAVEKFGNGEPVDAEDDEWVVV